jgi:hypothetical protein
MSSVPERPEGDGKSAPRPAATPEAIAALDEAYALLVAIGRRARARKAVERDEAES